MENLESPNDNIFQEDLDYIAKKIDWSELKDSTVLVTGTTGLIGSIIVKSLICSNRKNNTNINIIAMARSKEKFEELYYNCKNNNNLKMIYCDICDEFNIDYKIDYIIHCASCTASKEFVTHPVEVIDTSIWGTKNILNLAKAKNVKGMVYLSSMEAFGITDPKLESVKEEDLGYIDIHNVRSCYSEGKRIVECMCSCYAQEYKLNVKIARLAQVFGAGISKNENRVFAQFAKSVIEKKDIILHTKGLSYGNYCYSRDAVIAILMLLTKGEAGQAYNISNPKSNIMIKDMAEMVASKFGNGEIKVIFDIPEDNLKYGYAPDVKMKLNSDKMQKLGWKPEIDLEETYNRLIESMKK